ncbi:MAG: FAD-dependent oxidoreductase [Deltaproteobacteria bacterium]|nr:FAD-dependent oxidoreductase [Deltaproteobacteria bacterium]MBW2541820.1 FAD-dependent oxidoreductase [Deltaproteobacteria bacterium]
MNAPSANNNNGPSPGTQKPPRVPRVSRRGFLTAAAAATAGGVAGIVGGQAVEKRYRAPAGPFFGPRSHCPWIESAGIEDTPPLAWLRGDHTADVIIVGGGYTGLSTALHLAESFPKRRIVLLEGARIGYGASGRNDGLVLPFINGAEAIVHDLVEAERIDEARKVYEATSAGVKMIEDLSKTRGVNCEWEPVANLIGATTPNQEALLEGIHQMYAALELESTWLSEKELRRRVDVAGYRGAIAVPNSGMINPAKLATGLLALVRAAGVEVHEDSPVVDIAPGTTVSARTPRGAVRAPVLVLATNAYTPHLGFLRDRIAPIHSFSIATAPLTDTQIAALSWHGRQPFFDAKNFFDLFRLTADNRIVLSGGDAFYYYGGAAIDGEGHHDYGRLERTFRRLFPTLGDVPITHRWVGHVGTTLDTVPTIGAIGAEENILFAGGYTGHGVPVAILAGRLLRDLIAGEPLDRVYDFVLNRKPPRIPGEPFTSAGWGLAKRYMRWADAQ